MNVTGRALTAALALCALGVTACGGAQDDTGTGSAQATGPAASPAQTTPSGGSPEETASPGSPDDTPAPDPTGTAESADPGASSESAAPATGGAASPKPLAGKVVVVDPGHNENNFRHTAEINRLVDVQTQKKACDTTGTTTPNGYSEAAFTWDVSKRMTALLRARGAKVVLTRTPQTPFGPCITERAAIGNRARADAAISVHADGSAAGNRGFHVIMPKKIRSQTARMVAESEKLGLAVRKAFREGTGLPYSTYIGRQALDYRNDLGGLNLSTVPKVFIETGNMKNPAEARLFRSAEFRQKVALALVDGLQDYLR
ncbi:N-acetylmuramoyl-L-alanine amidase [Planobispora siamensis]|uniref:N-acetylmuramoyl-L-alanine amidase n=1 Tax=Planobispora siamensis TaxID=936338 RepID=A0A8J3SW20_9ACTN|nr:N-acetylmuramoyl-L-alanine amidase [Planobispora siamensis]GIH96583.1 N-acetylmuramoyl-L-alanine amidase [Planobispora siamensis]